jgi:hypothetical protein
MAVRRDRFTMMGSRTRVASIIDPWTKASPYPRIADHSLRRPCATLEWRPIRSMSTTMSTTIAGPTERMLFRFDTIRWILMLASLDNPMPERPESKRFWLVWNPRGPHPPEFRYPSFGSARSAAIRLSLKFPDQDFFVLETCWGKLGTPPTVVEPVAPDASTSDAEVAT